MTFVKFSLLLNTRQDHQKLKYYDQKSRDLGKVPLRFVLNLWDTQILVGIVKGTEVRLAVNKLLDHF